VTVLVWGAQLPVLYLLLERWDAVTLAVARYVVAVPVVLGVLWLREGGAPGGPGTPWGRLALLGVIGIGAISLLHTGGLAYSDPVTAIVVQSASPVVATGVAWAWLRVRPGPGMGVALALAVAGALLVRLSGGAGGPDTRLRGGELLLLLGSGCWAWYSLACQRWLPGYSQLRITAVTFLPGAAFLALVYGVAAAAGLTRGSGAMLLADALLVVWMAVSATCLGVLLWHYGVSRLGLPMAALYLNAVPVVSVLLAIAFGVVPTWLQIVGGGLVVAGVLQAQLRRLAAARGA
jgi:drug/metabolite transporter (DMT)-like permease